jgi:hypothetical protein
VGASGARRQKQFDYGRCQTDQESFPAETVKLEGATEMGDRVPLSACKLPLSPRVSSREGQVLAGILLRILPVVF